LRDVSSMLSWLRHFYPALASSTESDGKVAAPGSSVRAGRPDSTFP
jgi:hypothetical protein